MNKTSQWILLGVFVLLLAQGNLAYQATQDALQFWFNQLVPSMFVTMVVVSLCLHYQVFNRLPFLLAPLQSLFNLNQAGSTLFLSCLLMGAPAGATLVDQLVKEHRLSQQEGKRLVSCLSLATPSFIVMTCGALFMQDIRAGFLLWGIQLFLCMLFMLVWRHPRIELELPKQKISFFPTFKNAVKNSGIALFYIGGYLMMFLTLLNITTFFMPDFLVEIIKSIGEFSLGCRSIGQLSLSSMLRLALFAACLGFNGLCVHLQVFSLTENIQLDYRTFLFLRIIQALLGFALAIILAGLLL